MFTGASFTGVLIKNGIAISMDGKGAVFMRCTQPPRPQWPSTFNFIPNSHATTGMLCEWNSRCCA
jgi:hypothetical protein